MPEYLKVLILISSGIGLALICFTVGAFIMFKATVIPGSGRGFLKKPKGDVFTVLQDGVDEPFPGAGEPTEDEQHVIKKAGKFLDMLGGKG